MPTGMDARRKKAIRQCHSDLRTGIIVIHLLPSLHIDAGGFLTDVEDATIRESSGNVKQVDQLINVLLNKENKDFDYFCFVLEKEGCQACSNSLKVAEGLGSGATVGCPSIIPDIKNDYVELKRLFVSVCTTQGKPTLEEMKDLCIDLIEGVFIDIPRISRQVDDIKKAETLTELARVVCFHLSKWISYDFFNKVIAHFQPALESVKDRLMHYEDQLKPLLLQKLEYIAELQQREETPRGIAELAVKYRLDADGLLVKDLVTERDFLAQRLGVPEHLLQVLSWGDGSIVITYWIVRDVLPLAELALCREDVRAELIQHGVEDVYLGSHPSEQPDPVDQSLQTAHLQRRAIVTVLDAHCQDLDVTSLVSDLKGVGILTTEQCQKLVALDDKDRRHEALLYTLLAHDGPDTYHKLVECMGLRATFIAADLQATFKDLMKSPGALSVIGSSQGQKWARQWGLMKKSRSASYSGLRLPDFPTDGKGNELARPSAIKQREDARAKEADQHEAASLLAILRNLDQLSSGGHDFSEAIGIGLSKTEEDRLVSDCSLMKRVMKDLGEVLENTKTDSKLVVQGRKAEVGQAANVRVCAAVSKLPQARPNLDITSTVQQGYEVSFEMTGAAIPLCLPNDCEWNKQDRVCKKKKGVVRNALILQKQALKILESITGPVCVISIVGPCHTGKSYILSRLIGGERERSHFNLGHKMDPETMGIWIWDTPFQHQLADGTKVTMILMDTEGIDAANSTDRGDNQIFTLSVLLSSLLIYNSMGRPQREDLQKMNFVANLSKSIQMHAGKKLQAQEVSKFSEWAPKFMWLLRDVILEPTDERGTPCHVRDYLLQKVLVAEEVDEFQPDSDQQRFRRNLLNFFSAFDAETLPLPSSDKNVLSNMDNPMYQGDIRPDFLHQVENVRKRILNNCSAKRGLSPGSLVSGFQLGEMAKLFVDALNSPGGVLALGSTWDRVLEVTYESAMKGAVQCYEEKMSSFHMPCERTALLRHHGQAWDKALSKFQEALALDTDEACYDKYLRQLKEERVKGRLANYIQDNHTASHSQCRDLIQKLKGQHLDSIIEHLTAQTDFEDIKRAITTIHHEYNQQARGPAKDEVLDAFMEDLQKQGDKVTMQLQKLKNYDSEVAQQMERTRQQTLEKERKERERKMLEDQLLQSKLDHKTMLEHMQAKFAEDQQQMKRESQAQLEEQERRLQNLSDAKLTRLKLESEEQKKTLQIRLNTMQQSMQTTLDAQQQEMQQMRMEVNTFRGYQADLSKVQEAAQADAEIRQTRAKLDEVHQQAQEEEKHQRETMKLMQQQHEQEKAEIKRIEDEWRLYEERKIQELINANMEQMAMSAAENNKALTDMFRTMQAAQEQRNTEMNEMLTAFINKPAPAPPPRDEGCSIL